MQNRITLTLLAVLSTGCGLSIDSVLNSKGSTIKSQFIDAPVNGLSYIIDGNIKKSGKTTGQGEFECRPGETVEFQVGKPGKGLSIGKAACGEKIFIYDLEEVQSDPDQAAVIGAVLQTIAPPVDEKTPMDIPEIISQKDFVQANLPQTINELRSLESDDEASLQKLAETLGEKTKLSFSARSLEEAKKHMLTVAKNNARDSGARIQTDSPLATALTSKLGAPRSAKNYLSLDEDGFLDVLRDPQISLRGSGACKGLDAELGINHYIQKGERRLQVYLRQMDCGKSSLEHCYGQGFYDGKVERLGLVNFQTSINDYEIGAELNITNGRIVGFVTAKTPKQEDCVYRVNQALVPTIAPAKLKPYSSMAFKDSFFGRSFVFKGAMCYTATTSLMKRLEAEPMLKSFGQIQFSSKGLQTKDLTLEPSGYAIQGERLHIQVPIGKNFFAEFQTLGSYSSGQYLVGFINQGQVPSSEACMVLYEAESTELLGGFRSGKYVRDHLSCKYKDGSDSDTALEEIVTKLDTDFSKYFSINHEKRFFAENVDITEMIQSVEGTSFSLVSPDLEAIIKFNFFNEQTSGDVSISGTGEVNIDCKFTFKEDQATEVEPTELNISADFFGTYDISVESCLVSEGGDASLEAEGQAFIKKYLSNLVIDKDLSIVGGLPLAESYSSSEQATLNFGVGVNSFQLVLNKDGISSGDFVIKNADLTNKLLQCRLVVNKLTDPVAEVPAESKCTAQYDIKGIYLGYGLFSTFNYRYLCEDRTAQITSAPLDHLDIEYFGNHRNISADDFIFKCGEEVIAATPITHGQVEILPSTEVYRHLLKLSRPLKSGENCSLELAQNHDIVSVTGGVRAEPVKIFYSIKSPSAISLNVEPFGSNTISLKPSLNWITIQGSEYLSGLGELSSYSLTCHAGTYEHPLFKSWFSPAMNTLQVGLGTLPANSLCQFTVKGLMDAEGNAFKEVSYGFTTGE